MPTLYQVRATMLGKAEMSFVIDNIEALDDGSAIRCAREAATAMGHTHRLFSYRVIRRDSIVETKEESHAPHAQGRRAHHA